MFRIPVFLALAAAALLAASLRLYLTDGTYHTVREYQVLEDRVRYYSVERSGWEEVPKELVDLERTEGEIRQREETGRRETEFWKSEEEAERAERRKIARIPADAGVYWIDGDRARALPQAELGVETDKKREFLKIITPVPIVSGKRTVFIEGERSKNVIPTATPEFYLRLWQQERFAIVKLTSAKGRRVLEKWEVAPVTGEVFEQHGDIETFRREVGDNLYKVWPKQPLGPGEYAVIEFSLGEGNVQAWDFGYSPPPVK